MRSERGSALVIAVFMLVLLTAAGTALLFLSQNETRMGKTSLRSKKAFYLAEAAVEDGRTTLFAANGLNPFDDDLEAAAGGDDLLSFDPDTIRPVYDAAGEVTGFTGYGDDVPLRAWTTLAAGDDRGWYAAFLTNDPIDGMLSQTDSNERVMVTGVGAAGDSFEVVQAILKPFRFLPAVPASALTLLGPEPHFHNGDSNAQTHTGNDCGVPGGAFAPIVGAIGGSATGRVRSDMHRPDKFSSGPPPEFEGQETIGDLTDPTDPIIDAGGHGTIDTAWLDCAELKELVEYLATAADYYCNTDLGSCTFPITSPDSVTFIDGDLSNTPAGVYAGILVVTGELVYSGNTGWDGIILAIGEGRIVRAGGGAGNPTGGVVVANIDPTPDGPAADRDDWCSESPDGFGEAYYDASGGGASTVQWCSTFIDMANTVRSYRVAEFLQR